MHHRKQEKTCSTISRQLSWLIKGVVNGFIHFAKCKPPPNNNKITCSTFNALNIGIIVYYMNKILYKHQHHNLRSVITTYLIIVSNLRCCCASQRLGIFWRWISRLTPGFCQLGRKVLPWDLHRPTMNRKKTSLLNVQQLEQQHCEHVQKTDW